MNIIVKELPAQEVAYIRHVGSYFEPNDSWDKLMQWAIPQQLYPPRHFFIGISLDDPTVVPAEECRHDACVTIPAELAKESHTAVQFQTLAGGVYALYPYYDVPEKLNTHYQSVYGQWLPESEYEADPHRHCLEYSMNHPAEDPEGKCKVDLYVPIQRRG